MKKYHVYGIGNALVDMEFKIHPEFFDKVGVKKGVMTLVDEAVQNKIMDEIKLEGEKPAKMTAGGSAANTMIAISQFGGKAFYSCKVANDEYGQFYFNDLVKNGVDSNTGHDREKGITGKCLVMITPDADRTMNTFLGITETLSVKELDEDAIKNSDYLYMEGYVVTSPTGRQAAIKGREVAEKSGVKTSLTFSDPNIVKFFRDGLKAMLGPKGVDLLFCNESEALAWAETDDIQKAKEELKKIAKCFVVTLGEKGAEIFDSKNEIRIQPRKINAVDSNGAGDMFAGAFLYAITKGESFEAAGNFACLASSKIVSKLGCRLTQDEAKDILKEVKI